MADQLDEVLNDLQLSGDEGVRDQPPVPDQLQIPDFDEFEEMQIEQRCSEPPPRKDGRHSDRHLGKMRAARDKRIKDNLRQQLKVWIGKGC
eukprot:4026688-Pyramimonas_sp.AAC.1